MPPAFIDEIKQAIVADYTFLYDDYLYEDGKYPDPRTSAPGFIDELISLNKIYVGVSEGLFGMTFHCTYESEHGMGVRIRKYKVDKAYSVEIAWCLPPDETDTPL